MCCARVGRGGLAHIKQMRIFQILYMWLIDLPFWLPLVVAVVAVVAGVAVVGRSYELAKCMVRCFGLLCSLLTALKCFVALFAYL